MFVTYKTHYRIDATGHWIPDKLTLRIKPNGSLQAYDRLPLSFLVALINRKVIGAPWKDTVDIGATFKLKPGDDRNAVARLVSDAHTHVRLFEEQLAKSAELAPPVALQAAE